MILGRLSYCGVIIPQGLEASSFQTRQYIGGVRGMALCGTFMA